MHEKQPVCGDCYDNQICGFCDVCSKSMSNGVILQAGSKKYHPECFKCVNCDVGVRDQYYERNGSVFCEKCYYDAYIPLCYKCNLKIAPDFEGRLTVVEWQDRQFHQGCFSCDSCSTPFDDLKALNYNNNLYCDSCYNKVVQTKSSTQASNKSSTQSPTTSKLPVQDLPRVPPPSQVPPKPTISRATSITHITNGPSSATVSRQNSVASISSKTGIPNNLSSSTSRSSVGSAVPLSTSSVPNNSAPVQSSSPNISVSSMGSNTNTNSNNVLTSNVPRFSPLNFPSSGNNAGGSNYLISPSGKTPEFKQSSSATSSNSVLSNGYNPLKPRTEVQ